jgi:hypothetical protein
LLNTVIISTLSDGRGLSMVIPLRGALKRVFLNI